MYYNDPYANGNYGNGTYPSYPQGPYSNNGYTPYPNGHKPTNSLAIAAFILSMMQFFTVITVIPAIICGHIALRQIKQDGSEGAWTSHSRTHYQLYFSRPYRYRNYSLLCPRWNSANSWLK